MSAVVLSIPARRVEWGQLHKVGPGCYQTASLFDERGLVCQVTVHWPTQLPGVPVNCVTQDRQAGAQD